MNNFQKLVDIMTLLRSNYGCPWDKVQTSESIKPYLIEETYEVIEAIDEKRSCENEGRAWRSPAPGRFPRADR